MLKIRVLTSLIILSVTLAVVFLAPPWVFRSVVSLVLLGACWEFRRIADLSLTSGSVLLGLQGIVLGLLLWQWPPAGAHWRAVLAIGCLFWLVMMSRLLRFRAGVGPTPAFRRAGAISALAAGSFCGFALFWLRDQPRGNVVVFLLFWLIWAADVGAYFAGRWLGRRKLAPAISPGKTVEGVYGGAALAIAATFLLANGIAGLQLSPASLAAISVTTILASVGGDLFISLHKRTVQVKDTGTLFPGHGGILDRYDSLLAGAPFFALTFGLLAP